jgi:hypothetical protein
MAGVGGKAAALLGGLGHVKDLMGAGQSAAHLFGGGGGGHRHHMNVGNVKALRRSMRRVEGFAKLAHKTMSFVTHHKLKTRGKRAHR